jgi:hypothetical protein
VQPLKNFLAFYGTPKVQYRVHKSPPLLPILSHISPIHTSKFHFNIVHPPTSWSSQWSLSSWCSFSPPFVLHDQPISSFLMSRILMLHCAKRNRYDARTALLSSPRMRMRECLLREPIMSSKPSFCLSAHCRYVVL